MTSTTPTQHSVIKSHTHLESLLGYLGVLPFAYLMLGLPLPSIVTVEPVQAFIAYSVVILSFMAGAIWRSSPFSNVISNLLAIAAFGVLVVPIQSVLVVLVLALLFVLLWGWEWHSLKHSYSITYWRLRCRLTALTVMCHVLFLWLR